ncbi:MAG: serine/threonine-protein kinase [Acidobacteria bacterium]|nr:serine/threonine-protein kinase [Acidobacteriota bacterium]
MRSEDWQRVEELLDAALELGPRERPRLLDEACAGAPDLRREVESLLACEGRADGFLGAPALAFSADFFDDGNPADGRAGQTFGPYRVAREIGRGGMGAVFLAERDDGEFKQEVALKVVGRSFADAELRRRFRQERRILATLNHPNIARLLDGGVSADGEPYLVMEYVEGLRVDEYCARAGLSTVEKLRLFLEVCRGVSYAHQHLVVHRDIKPSNILVTADGVPKLLDFGIAKLLVEEQPGEQTRTELRAFTPEYAAPEQVSGGQVTTASDVYSLGVLLRDLTGPRRLAGEMENIVAMARHEEPARRYGSAAQLAEDIHRYLEGRPVRARKDSFTYRAGKFVRRNTVGVAAAALVLLTLAGGVVATVWQARRATEQARLAAQERDRARREAAKAERINTFLQNVLGLSDASWVSSNPNRNREATIADVLDEAGRRAEAELADQPEVQAAVRFTLGWTYKTQSRLDAAEPHLRASLELRRAALGSEHQDTAQSLVGMGELSLLGGKFDEAEALLREAVAIHRRARAAGDVNAKWFAISLSDLGLALTSKGDTAAGEASFLEALEVGAALTGADRALMAVVHSNIGATHRERGDLDGAIVHTQRGLEEYRRLPGEPRWEMAAALGNLAGILTLKGDYDRAEPLARESLDVYRGTVGEEHAYPPRSFAALAEIYYRRGDYPRAKEEIERALAIQQRVLAESHIDFARSWIVLGKILTRAGDPARGETYLRRALERRGRGLKPGHWMVGEAQGALGECLTARGRYAEAEPLLAESHKNLDAALGHKDPRTREARRRLVTLYEAWRKPETAARFAQP